VALRLHKKSFLKFLLITSITHAAFIHKPHQHTSPKYRVLLGVSHLQIIQQRNVQNSQKGIVGLRVPPRPPQLLRHFLLELRIYHPEAIGSPHTFPIAQNEVEAKRSQILCLVQICQLKQLCHILNINTLLKIRLSIYSLTHDVRYYNSCAPVF